MTSSAYPISTFSWQAAIFLFVMSAFPGGLVFLAMRGAGESQALGWAAVLTVLVLPVFGFLAVQLFLVKAEITASKLLVGGGLYKIEVPLAAMQLDKARVSSSRSDAPKLYLRTNGIGMPGLNLGWFSISRRKIFAAVSKPAHSIYIPTTLDYDLIVAPLDQQAFLADLREAQGRFARAPSR